MKNWSKITQTFTESGWQRDPFTEIKVHLEFSNKYGQNHSASEVIMNRDKSKNTSFIERLNAYLSNSCHLILHDCVAQGDYFFQ